MRGATSTPGVLYSGSALGSGLGLAMLIVVLVRRFDLRVVIKLLVIIRLLWLLPVKKVFGPTVVKNLVPVRLWALGASGTKDVMTLVLVRCLDRVLTLLTLLNITGQMSGRCPTLWMRVFTSW